VQGDLDCHKAEAGRKRQVEEDLTRRAGAVRLVRIASTHMRRGPWRDRHLSPLGRNQASETADVTVLENQRSAFASASHGDIHHGSGRVVGRNHLVGKQHPNAG